MPVAQEAADEEDETVVAEQGTIYETINKAAALWTRPRNEITDEEYQVFISTSLMITIIL